MQNIPFLILFLIAFGHTKSKEEKLEDINISMSLLNVEEPYELNLLSIYKHLTFDEIPKTVPYGEHRIKRFANLILKDSIPVLHTLPVEYLPFDDITWGEDPQNNTTWQLYFENLFFVSVLNHQYDTTKEIAYHNRAKQYINCYTDRHTDLTRKSSKYTWNDHSTAFRTLHVLQTVHNELSLEDPDFVFIEKSFAHITNNVSFMMNSSNYKTHNHSLMMDRSLLYLAKITKTNKEFSEKIKNVASNRALANFDKIIDESGLAKEHSTTYHIFNHNLYKSIFSLLDKNDLSDKILDKRDKRVDVLLQLYKPDKTFINWGDSQLELLSEGFIKKFGDHNGRLKNVLNDSVLSSMVSFENNIATLRSKSRNKSLVTLFANYYSKVHKHNDDLSFVYHTLGTDILTDQGYFGYDKTYRPLLTSVFGHNGIAINDENYKIKFGSSQTSSLCHYVQNKNYEIIEGEHTMYDSITVMRKLIYIKPNLIILKDSAFSNDNKSIKTIGQQFNLGVEAKNIRVNKNSAFVDFNNDLKIRIKSLNSSAEITEENIFYSRIPNQIEPRKQVKFKHNGQSSTILIKVSSAAYFQPAKIVKILNDRVLFKKNDTLNTIKW